jgi:hypothetical protein
MCHQPATCVVLSAGDGKILATLPIGNGTDGGGFNPATMEAFSSQGDGTLTIIKETSPTGFGVEQTVTTRARAKTCTLDTKNNQIVLIATERPATPPAAAGTNAMGTPPLSYQWTFNTTNIAAATSPAGMTNQPAGGERRGGRGYSGPAMLDILVVGK